MYPQEAVLSMSTMYDVCAYTRGKPVMVTARQASVGGTPVSFTTALVKPYRSTQRES